MADGKGGKKYFGGSKETAKAWRAGWLNQASDFAHSSEESFKKRGLMERAMMFGVAAAASITGGAEEERIKDIKNNFNRGILGGLRQAAAGYLEYDLQQRVHFMFSGEGDKSYLPWQYKYKGIKLSAAGYKALFYGLKIGMN
jgi:hypothetical protein